MRAAGNKKPEGMKKKHKASYWAEETIQETTFRQKRKKKCQKDSDENF